MQYLKFKSTVPTLHSEQTRGRTGAISTLIASVMILGAVWANFAIATLPVKADSEASSESGAYLRPRRGRRYWNNQNQQNPESMAVKQELKREAKERNQAQQRQQRNLARGPQIKEYGHQHRGKFGSGQSNQAQSNQGQSNQAQSNQGQSNQGQNNQKP